MMNVVDILARRTEAVPLDDWSRWWHGVPSRQEVERYFCASETKK